MNFLVINIILFTVLLQSCNSNNIIKGEKIKKEISIDFDSISIENNDWISFRVIKDIDTRVDFSKGETFNDIYKITAQNNLKTNDPIIVSIYSNKIGTHYCKLVFDSCSPTIEPEFIDKNAIEIKAFHVESKWVKRIKIYMIILLIMGLFAYTFYYFHKKANSFESGRIDYTYPKMMRKSLYGKCKIDLLEDVVPKKERDNQITAVIYCYVEKSESNKTKKAELVLGKSIRATVNGNQIEQEKQKSFFLKDKDKVILEDDKSLLKRSFQFYK